MGRTSVKALLIAVGLVIVGVVCMYAAEAYYRSLPNRINFGLDMGRPWNSWDYLWVSAFVLAMAVFVVALMFANKDD